MLVDDADEHGLFFPGIGADGIDLGTAMAKGLHDLPGQRFLMIGDDGKLIGRFGVFQHPAPLRSLLNYSPLTSLSPRHVFFGTVIS